MKKYQKTEIILLIVVIISVIGSQLLQKKFYENYEGMNISLLPGKYPISVDAPILVKDYPLKKPARLNYNTQNEWKNYPVFSSSYAQRTNNVEYWPSPDNGMCSPMEFCGAMYNKKQLVIPGEPKPIPLNCPAIRVNYYASNTNPTQII